MGGCMSHKRVAVDNKESVTVGLEPGSVLQQSSENDTVPINVDQFPAKGGLLETVDEIIQKDEVSQKSDEFNLAVSTNQGEQAPPVSSNVQDDYNDSNEEVYLVTHENTGQNFIQPIHQPILTEQPQHPVSIPMDQPAVPPQSLSAEAKMDMKDDSQDVKIEGAQYIDQGVVFEGRVYQTKVFDEVINDYVYIQNDVQPRGGFAM